MYSKTFNQKSVFQKILLSYTIILIIPLIISCITYIKAKNMVEGEIKRANEALINQVRYVIDEKILEAQSIAVQVGMDTRVDSSIRDDSSFLEADRFNEYKIVEQLKLLKATNSFIKDIYIYYNNSKTVISTRVKLDSREFYDTYYKNEALPYEIWKSKFENTQIRTLQQGFEQEGGSTVELIQPLPINSRPNYYASVVIVFDSEQLKKYVRNVEWLKDGSATLVFYNNKLLLSSDSKYNNLEISKYDSKKDFFYSVINEQRYVIKIFTSQTTGCKYVSIIPYSLFWSRVADFRNLNILGAVGFLVFGCIAAFYLSRKNYNPIKLVLNKISQKSNVNYNKKENSEFEFIDIIFNLTIDEKDILKEKIRSEEDIIRENFLYKVLIAGFIEENSLEEIHSRYGIELLSKYFVVMLFHVENYNDNNITKWYNKNPFEFISFIMRNIIGELSSKTHKGFIVELDEKNFACIVNLAYNEENIIDTDVKNICDESKKILEERFKILCSVAISNIHTDFQNINEAYNEAMNALEYRIVQGKNNIIFYKNIENIISEYQYNTKVENKLMNFMKSCADSSQAVSIVNEIFDQNGLNGKVSLKKTKYFIYDMTTTLAKVVNEVCEPAFIHENNPINRIMACETLLDLKQELTSVIMEVCDHLIMKKNQNLLSTEVIHFIDENYYDTNISINMLGERFDISPSYLSKVFKDGEGISILEYLSKVRIEKSKQLLKETDYGINEIASRVGFLSSSVFIRAFKKYEGITPGAFREV